MPTWPAGLPQSFLMAGFNVIKQPQSRRAGADRGPASQRRGFSAASELASGFMHMTPDEYYDTARPFFDTTLLGGSITFDWQHPITLAAATMRFVADAPEALAITSIISHDKLHVSIRVEIMP